MGGVTAKELAREEGIRRMSACKKLKRWYDKGQLEREAISLENGGSKYIYYKTDNEEG